MIVKLIILNFKSFFFSFKRFWAKARIIFKAGNSLYNISFVLNITSTNDL